MRGRHSLIGLAPDLVFRATGDRAEVNPRWLADRAAFAPCAEPTLAALRALVASCRMPVPSELPRAASPASSAISAMRPSGWSSGWRARRQSDRRAPT
ncbi:MAG: hypothetical protein WDN44_10455 [Sphingomonas sp.]